MLIKEYGCFFFYLNFMYFLIMVNEIKFLFVVDFEYIMRLDVCFGCMLKIVVNLFFCVIINFRDNFMYELLIVLFWK